MENPKILIIGLGQIGYHNAEYMTGLGLRIEGYDLKKSAVKRAIETGVIQKEAKTFRGYDYYVVCVSTHDPANMSQPSFDGLLEIAERLEKEGEGGKLVSIESTISKGISNKVNGILNHRLHVAHIPHRFYSEEKKEHGVRQLRVLGGCKPCCTHEALGFYAGILHIPVHSVRSVELAELSKIVENAHRFLEVAFAEELKMFCDVEDLDFEELRVAVNSKWNTRILEARDGIGGHCLPKDTKILVDLQQSSLPFSTLTTAIQSDSSYKRRINGKLDLQLASPQLVSSQFSSLAE
jgi:UDP-N-acetyl-D-mannosaminuronate dehydrogenase